MPTFTLNNPSANSAADPSGPDFARNVQGTYKLDQTATTGVNTFTSSDLNSIVVFDDTAVTAATTIALPIPSTSTEARSMLGKTITFIIGVDSSGSGVITFKDALTGTANITFVDAVGSRLGATSNDVAIVSNTVTWAVTAKLGDLLTFTPIATTATTVKYLMEGIVTA